MSNGGEVVYLAAYQSMNATRVFHTNPDCRLLKRVDEPVEKPLSTLPNHRECSVCSGDYEGHDGGGRGHYEALLREAGST